MRRKKLFYYVTSGSNVTRDVHWCLTVDYQQIANSNIANQIHGFTIDYSKFIQKIHIVQHGAKGDNTGFRWGNMWQVFERHSKTCNFVGRV